MGYYNLLQPKWDHLYLFVHIFCNLRNAFGLIVKKGWSYWGMH